MRSTWQDSGTALSMGLFFSLMITGLASSLPRALDSGLRAQGGCGPASSTASS